MQEKPKNYLVNQRVGIIRPKKKEDADYLFAVLALDTYEEQLFTIGLGAGQPNVSANDIGGLDIPYPDGSKRTLIGEIRTAYDGLIENNTRRIAILETIAQNLYREWFINFRFPNHEQTMWQDTPQGKIPLGWRTSSFGELVELVRDNVPKGTLETDTPYIGLEHLPRKSIALSDWEIVNEIGSSKLKYKKYDILFGKIRPYFHKVGVAQTNGICSADTFVWRSVQPELFGLALCIASSDDFVLHSNQTSQGTKMPRANWDVLKNYAIAIPPQDLIHQFNETVKNIVAQIIVLSSKNRNLKQQRDMLLPKLISTGA